MQISSKAALFVFIYSESRRRSLLPRNAVSFLLICVPTARLRSGCMVTIAISGQVLLQDECGFYLMMHVYFIGFRLIRKCYSQSHPNSDQAILPSPLHFSQSQSYSSNRIPGPHQFPRPPKDPGILAKSKESSSCHVYRIQSFSFGIDKLVHVTRQCIYPMEWLPGYQWLLQSFWHSPYNLVGRRLPVWRYRRGGKMVIVPSIKIDKVMLCSSWRWMCCCGGMCRRRVV